MLNSCSFKRILRIWELRLIDFVEYQKLTELKYSYNDLKIKNIIELEYASKGYKRALFILVVIIINHEV